MTRLWQPAQSIQVTILDDLPRHIRWETQGYQVEGIVYRWRRREWWRGIWREYYKLTLNGGSQHLLVIIYHDLPDGDWFIQELYD